MEHKIRTTINNLMPTNPVYYTSLRQRLEKIIQDHKQKILDDLKLLDELDKLKEDLDAEAIAKKHDMKKEEFAVYKLLKSQTQKEEKQLTKASKEMYAKLEGLAVIDWKEKRNHQKIMEKAIKRTLYKLDFEIEEANKLANEIMDLARSIL
jgi:type I restriction enzyme R subunit